MHLFKGPFSYYVSAFWGFFGPQNLPKVIFSNNILRENCHFRNHLPYLISVEFFLFFQRKFYQLHVFHYTNEKKVPIPRFFTYINGNNILTPSLFQLHSYFLFALRNKLTLNRERNLKVYIHILNSLIMY